MQTFNTSELNFSASAIAHFHQMLSERGRGEGVKVGIKEAGCSGYEYTFDFVDNFDEEHILIETSACNVFIDSKSYSYLKGSLIDYVDEGLNQGIKFVNPNAKAVCGCGESFTI